MTEQCAAALAAMRQEIEVVRALDSETLLAAQRLRHSVFCEEREILDSVDGVERDNFDSRAHHVVLRRRRTGELVGTVRLVPFSPDTPGACFPMQKVCDPALLAGAPLHTMGEISRFALSKQRREMNCPSDTLMRLALMKGVLSVSLELGLTHWCAAMEPALLRLLRTASIHFQPVGPLVEYRGLRQPAIGAIEAILARGKRERPDVFAYVTADCPTGNTDILERLAA